MENMIIDEKTINKNIQYALSVIAENVDKDGNRCHHNKTATEVLLLRFFVVFGSFLYHYMYNCFTTSCNYIFEFNSSGNCKIGLLCTSIPLLKIFSTDF